MKRNFFVAVFVMCLTVLASCKSKEENIISRLDRLYERIDKNGSEFESEDWEEAIEDFADIHEDMEDCDFTEEQLREIGKKEGKISVVLFREGTKALGGQVKNLLGKFGAFASGFVEGSTDDDGNNEFEKASDDLNKEINNFLNSLGK